MLNEICRELRNWFDREKPKMYGRFTIASGKITDSTFLAVIHENQYFRIVGSVFNDGIYKYDNELNLEDETFDGAIWLLAIPQEIIDLDAEVTAWIAKYGDAVSTPYNSESFGGYSYSKATSASGTVESWQSAFAAKLNLWRKI